MPIAYHSATIQAPVEDVWAAARDFGNYRLFTSGRGEVTLESGSSGDCVGAIRCATLDGTTVRQRLLAHSDRDRSYQYEFCTAPPFHAANYVATLRFRPVVESGETFVEWYARFDCDLDGGDAICASLKASFAAWIASMRHALVSASR